MPKFFRFPWASTGDKTTIPDETDVAGFVSYQQGYGNDYARDPASDPLAKLIERDKMNQLYSDLTENAQYWQTHAFPEYITAAQNGGVAYAYDVHSIVRYDGGTGYKVYQNTVAGNTNLPTGAGWVEYKIEALINAATAKATPADGDIFAILDSAASFALKKITWANIKTALTSVFAPTSSPTFTGTVSLDTNAKLVFEGSTADAYETTLTVVNPTADRTLSLPNESGTIATQEYIPTALNASGSAPMYACRAWVNFNGTGTVAIRASGNVSSITDNGVGMYTVNFITAMPDANYSVVGSPIGDTTGSSFFISNDKTRPNASSSFSVIVLDVGNAVRDVTNVNLAVIR